MHTNLPRRRSSLSRVGWMEGCVRAESQQVPNGSAGSRQWWDVSKIILYCFVLFFALLSTLRLFLGKYSRALERFYLKYVRLFMAWIFRQLSRGFCRAFTKQHGDKHLLRDVWEVKEIYFKITPLWTHLEGFIAKIIFNLQNLHELCRMQWIFFSSLSIQNTALSRQF